MDEAFLASAYDGLIDSHLKSCVLALVLDKCDKRLLARAVLAGKTLLNDEVVTAQEVSLEKDLRGAIDLLPEIAAGRGPTANELGKMSLWCSVFIKKFDDETGKISKTTLVGGDALRRRFQACENFPGVKDAWLSTSAELNKYKEWQRHAIETSSLRMKDSKAQMLKDCEESAKKTKHLRHLQPRALQHHH